MRFFHMEQSGLLLRMLLIAGILGMFWTDCTKDCTRAWKVYGANVSNLWWAKTSTDSWTQESAEFFSKMWLQRLTSPLPTMRTITLATWTLGHSKLLAASEDALISSCAAKTCALLRHIFTFTFARPSQRLRSCKGHGVTQLYKPKWARQNCT